MLERFKALLNASAELQPFTIPLFPLQALVFPGGVLPLKVFEQRYMDMAKECLRTETPFGVCLIKEGPEVGAAAVPHRIGTLVRIDQWDMPQLGVLNVRVVGLQRFEVQSYEAQPDGLLIASVIRIPVEPNPPLPAEHAACAMVLEQIIEHLGQDKFEPPFLYEDSTWVGYRLAEILPIKSSAKQDMLEMNDAQIRLDVLHKFLAKQGLTT